MRSGVHKIWARYMCMDAQTCCMKPLLLEGMFHKYHCPGQMSLSFWISGVRCFMQCPADAPVSGSSKLSPSSFPSRSTCIPGMSMTACKSWPSDMATPVCFACAVVRAVSRAGLRTPNYTFAAKNVCCTGPPHPQADKGSGSRGELSELRSNFSVLAWSSR